MGEWSIDLSKQLQYQPLFLYRILQSIFRFAIPLKNISSSLSRARVIQHPDAFLSENRTPEEFILTLLSPKEFSVFSFNTYFFYLSNARRFYSPMGKLCSLMGSLGGGGGGGAGSSEKNRPSRVGHWKI